jgi:RimJ/RimL family protein N-acetyltransferase
MEHEASNLRLWRLGGKTLGPEQSVQSLWQGTLFQFAIETIKAGEFVGIVNCHNADLQHGVADFALISTNRFRSTGLALDAAFVALDYAFGTFPLRKIYAHTSDEALARFESITKDIFSVEARLTDHFYRDQAFHDKVILSVDARHWHTVRNRWEDFVLGRPDEPEPE